MNMKTNEILNRLSNLYHQYDIVEDKDLKSISNALMRDMPKYVLNDVRYNWLKRGLNYTLCAKARGFLKHREKVVRFNEPISVLLDYYNNKRSRKVVYARTQLKRRFEYMDGSEQKQIILSFLNGSKWDVFWGMSKALFRWDNSFIEPIKRYWEVDDDGKRAEFSHYTVPLIMKYFPKHYILKYSHRISDYMCFYAQLCIVLGNEDDFDLKWDSLLPGEDVYVKVNLGIPVDIDEVEKSMWKYIKEIVSTNCSEEYTEPILLDYRLGKYIWSMGKLGMHDALFRLYEFLIKAKTHIEAYNLNGLCNVIKTELEKTQQ